MTIGEAVLLGAIQGITEFLPVSSDGHLSLANFFLGTSQGGRSSLLFTVMLHLGTLVSVLVVFRRRILALLKEFFLLARDLLTGRIKEKGITETRRLLLMLMVSLLPCFLVLPFRNSVELLSGDRDILAEGFCFLFNGGLLLLASGQTAGNRSAGSIQARDSLITGFFQALAALPGVSRSGATISSGLLLGLSGETAVEFSFLMGIPVILAANILEIAGAVKAKVPFDLPVSLTGMAVAAGVGFLAVGALKWLVKKQKLSIFGWYCLAVGIFATSAGLAIKFSIF